MGVSCFGDEDIRPASPPPGQHWPLQASPGGRSSPELLFSPPEVLPSALGEAFRAQRSPCKAEVSLVPAARAGHLPAPGARSPLCTGEMGTGHGDSVSLKP